MSQIGFTDLEYSNRKRKTKRDEFLEIMDKTIVWEEWVEHIMPYYPDGKRGRPTRGAEIMLRMYLLQNWFNLSDEGVEDAIYDSYAFRKFMGLNFMDEQTPDATTLCKFRKLLDENGVTQMFFENMKRFLDKHGKLMHGGTIVDATIVDAPTSTKNAEKKRDPEMGHAKKGRQWYFGARFHIGVDAGTGYIHTNSVAAANVSERDIAPRLVRNDDEVVYGDSAYSNMYVHKDIKSDPHLSSIDWRTNDKKPYRKHTWQSGPGIFWFNYMQYHKSRVRYKVEYAFLVIKRIFGYRKIRYRGIHKNQTQAHMLCALANLYMLAQASKAGAT